MSDSPITDIRNRFRLFFALTGIYKFILEAMKEDEMLKEWAVKCKEKKQPTKDVRAKIIATFNQMQTMIMSFKGFLSPELYEVVAKNTTAVEMGEMCDIIIDLSTLDVEQLEKVQEYIKTLK